MGDPQPFHQVWFLLSRHVASPPAFVGRQFTADDMQDVADWCGGEIATDAGQTVLEVPRHPYDDTTGGTARLGDYVLTFTQPNGFWVVPADGFQQKWATTAEFEAWQQDPGQPTRVDAPFTITHPSAAEAVPTS